MTSYAAHLLPQTGDNLSLYADKYSQLRITALQQDPGKFAVTIADEMALTKEEKLERLLQRDRKMIIVAVQSGKEDWLEEEWVGSVNILEPWSKERYWEVHKLHNDVLMEHYTYEDNDEVQNRQSSAYYHMIALFVDKNHRRRGIAKILCEKSFQVAVDESKQADMRIYIHPDNVTVFDMYKQLGFKTAKQHCTLAEALAVSNEPLPASYNTDERYNSRRGVIMVRLLG